MERLMKWGISGRSAAAVLLTAALAGCAATPESCRMNNTATGAAVGAVLGGGLGAAIAASSHASGGAIAAAAAGGVLVGGLVGAMAGRQQDQACHQLALKQALDQAVALNQSRAPQQSQAQASSAPAKPYVPSGPPPKYQSVEWANQATKNGGTIVPLNTVADAPADQVCVTYYDQQSTSGQTQATTGKACRTPNGEWKPAA
jgi:surface antigen